MSALPPRPTRISRDRVHRARELRRSATPCERKLWSVLRQFRTSDGLHFRRQAPMGPYIADFCCHRLKVIIEADGEGHDDSSDAVRDAWFRRAGYRTIRIPNVWIRDSSGDLGVTLRRLLGLPDARLDASARDCPTPSTRRSASLADLP